MGFLSDVGSFFFGQELIPELTPEATGLFGDIGTRLGEIRGAPVLDAATIALIRAVTGAAARSGGQAIGQRLAGQGTLGGGIGNQALAMIEGQRQSSLAQALAQAAIAGRRQNLAFESGLLGQQVGILDTAQVPQFQPGLLQGVAGGIGQGIGFGIGGNIPLPFGLGG